MSSKVIVKVVALLISFAVGLGIAEGCLRLAEKYQNADRATAPTVDDPELGFRMTPGSPGHDPNGFRNDVTPERVDVVAIGDSQTWGVNVNKSDAWPQQLEKLSGQTVYNMAVGGYGPVQYWKLTDRALTMGPKAIVVGLYFGNDLYDAYSLIYTRNLYPELRNSAIEKQIEVDTVTPASQAFWDEEKDFHNGYGRASLSGSTFWLREHSAIGRLLNRVGLWPGATDVDFEIDKEWVREHPDHGAICDEPAIRTVFTTAYRETALNLNDPHISEGERITKEMFVRMQAAVLTKGVRLIVLLIPTKESVYADVMRGNGLSVGTYARLVGWETQARSDILNWCSEKRISCVDALPALQKAVAVGQRIYPSSTESHPNAAGYAILAATVENALK